MTIVKYLHTIDMADKDRKKYKDFDSSSETSSFGSDESLEQAAGPNFADFAKQLAYNTSDGREGTSYYYPYEGPDAGEKPDPQYDFPSTILQKIELPKTTDITTLFLVDSVNRDKKAFPQPTSLTLKLPRVYKNVKSLQISQVKLLCSFYYFSSAKSNIFLPIIEKGRESIGTYNRGTVSKTITIRQGTFGISDLLSEIQTEMNFTPVFYDFPRGFEDFIKIFTINGDFSINFNQPGDSYYDRLNSKYIQNPTLSIILSYYWGSRYAGLTEYTIDQLKVAYYYPVLYELLLDTEDKIIGPLLKVDVPANLLSVGETAYSHLIFNMSGINDKVALHMISQNLGILIDGISILDTYRLKHTFRYSLVNRYQVAYDTNSLQVNFITTSLNTSLVNLINNTGTSALTSILSNLGYTPTTYLALQTSAGKSAVIYSDMFQFLQSQLITLLGIPFGTYSSQYFNTLTNTIYFQNGLNASGVRTGYTLDYLTSGQTPLSSIMVTSSNSPIYWPNMNSANGYNGFAKSNINPAESLYPYNSYSKNFQFDTQSIDPSTFYINTNRTTRSVDIMIKILPAKYTVLKFRSPVRQSLQVETLPLPYYYRYADYNIQGLYKGILDPNNSNVPQKYFDLSYNFIYNATNKMMDISNYSSLTTTLLTTFGQSLQTALSTTSSFRITSQSNYSQFEFIAPYPPELSSGICRTTTSLSFVSVLSSMSTVFPDNFSAFLYHDRGTFMADLQFPRAEKSIHYIRTSTVGTSNTDLTFTFSTFAGHKYYAIFRSNNLACSNLTYKPIVYNTDTNFTEISTNYSTFNPNGNPFLSTNLLTGEYVKNYNTDFTRLPTASSLMGFNPDSSTFTVALTIKNTPIGYDISGVSNDLTDYMGYIFDEPGFYPNRPYSIDPLSYYIFQSNTPFNVNQGTYFDSNSQNSLLYPDTNNNYTFKGISTAQVKIVHWYEGYSIPVQIDDKFTTLKTIGIAETSNITDYVRKFPMDPNDNIILGRGIKAIGFLPNDGVFEVSSFTFKSCIYPLTSTESTSEDPNMRIKYIGVFSGTTLADGIITLESALTVLQFSKTVPYGPGTSNLTPGYKAEYGTWYEYVYDPSYVKSSDVNINGYTPLSSELLNYTSMYYMVPFSAQGTNLTYSLLSGSLLPYPLAQEVTISTTFFGQTAKATLGTTKQPEYIVPVELEDADPAYGPQGNYSQTQSQYQQSIPITTTSIGYKELPYIVNTVQAPYTFSMSFPTSLADISLTTYFSEYSDTLFLVNSVNQVCSNAAKSFQSATYSNSLQSILATNPLAKPDCIEYLLHPPSTLQNYPLNGTSVKFSTFTFQEMSNRDSNVTIRSFDIDPSMSNIEIRLWGGGGGTWLNTSTICGGAGAYAKVTLDVSTLNASFGISTLYLVVGKGGNRDNVSTIETVGSLQQYEEPRYGGGGTTLLNNPLERANIISDFAFGLQGGGFSGLFTGPNLITDMPLIIVGGGGAAGAYDLGGPGGFGIIELPMESIYYPFNTAVFSGKYYSSVEISTIKDIHGNSVLNGTLLQNAIDGDLTTSWDPSIPAKLNPSNYLSTPNTYALTVSFSAPLQNISKLRFYGPPQDSTANLPTGIILYSSENRAEVLYSNTSIQPSDFQTVDNGTFLQQVFDLIPTSQPSTTTFTGPAWIVGGTNTTPQGCIQYSLDKRTWVSTNNSLLNSVTSLLYVSSFSKWFAAGSPILSSSPIISSSDGINWTTCSITSSPITTMAYGSNALVLGSDTGKLFYSSDGLTFTLANLSLTSQITRIRYSNGQFWAFGKSDITIVKSSDGITWTRLMAFTNGVNDITYGQGKYVIAQEITALPYTSGLIYSTDGATWYKVSQINVAGFSGQSVIFANGLFVATGTTSDSSSLIKTSVDGINWINSNLPSTGKLVLEDIQYLGNVFLAVGKAKLVSGKAGNQTSIVTSSDARNWSYSYSGGFDPELSSDTTGTTSAYGPISIVPNLASFYMEIQKDSSVTDELTFYELRVYDTESPIVVSTASLTDSSGTSVFHPPEDETVDVIEYPFIFTVKPDSSGNYQDLVNELHIVLPDVPTALFTGITVSLDETSSSLVYSDQDLTIDSFTFDDITRTYHYTALFIPSLIDVTSLNIRFSKATPGSLQVKYITLVNNPNTVATELPTSTVTDIDSREERSPIESVTSINDGSLETSWYPSSFLTGDSLRIEFTFDSPQERINHLQIFNGPYPSVDKHLITGITIYSDTTKSTVLYTTDEPIISQYLSYSIIDIEILPLVGYSSVYIELFKNTPGIPLINEIRFYNVGYDSGTLNGFSAAATIQTMNRTPYSLLAENGGGGSLTEGGDSGPLAYKGGYLTGGSPAILLNQPDIVSTEEIQLGSGGGGGGYYGGGGGGVTSDGYGGAGGGGAGYMYSSSQLFTNIEFEVAVAAIDTSTENFIAPGLDEQLSLISQDVLLSKTIPYGQGGSPGLDSGQGGHGLIVITYDSPFSFSNNYNTSPVYPSFIDGSKLTVFEAPIDYSSQQRTIPFSTFTDSIELTDYAGFNWVWYSSYLSLLGCSLSPQFVPYELDSDNNLISNYDVAKISFPALVEGDFDSLSELYGDVDAFFTTGSTPELTTSITSAIQGIFSGFQKLFTEMSFFDSDGNPLEFLDSDDAVMYTYEDFTELYCLLDYLQNPSNLTSPHVSLTNPTLERILGGVPRFGYWANPFLVSASYIGFDVTTSQLPSSQLSTLVENGEPVRAMYGLIMEMSLVTGAYSFKDVMAYKPSLEDAELHGSNWLNVTQFPEGYVVRSLSDPKYLAKTIPVQPFSFKNAISARLPLFRYSVYTSPSDISGSIYDIPIQVLNDFEGGNIYLYSFQNKDTNDQSTINISQIPLTSTTIQMNQQSITNQLTTNGAVLGTLVSEYASASVQGITFFGFNGVNYVPQISYGRGIYNTFSTGSAIQASSVGKAIVDQYGNYFLTDNLGSSELYQNTGTSSINPTPFNGNDTTYNSPLFNLGRYASNTLPRYDFFESKYTNIWHLSAQGNVSSMTGIRLSSPYDYNELTSFVNQIFYPTHKITLIKKSSLLNPIQNTTDIDTYPSYQHTQMFYYKNYSTMVLDIDGKFAMENTRNFAKADMFSGYGFNSYIYNINLEQSLPLPANNTDDYFNYLAIRAYSPTETFQSLVRFYLPQRYDFGYITLRDLSNQEVNIQNASNVNPDYRSFLSTFNNAFSTTRNYGAVGFPGFFGSNVTTESFGDFLTKFNTLNTANASNAAIISTVTGLSNAAIQGLIRGDLQYILPSYLADRNRTTDPIEFRIPFSTCVTPSNASSEQYGIGYNLGFTLQDTPFTTVQRATSFFKILDDYIYLQLNEEFGMNKMDISKPENFAQTRDTTAQSGLYNSKLMLNTFGSFATTFVQSPVAFNPPIGKIDTLSFSWYDANGALLNNNDCEWSGTVQIVEAVTATP